VDIQVEAMGLLKRFDQPDHKMLEDLVGPYLKSPSDSIRLRAAKFFGDIKDKNMVPTLLDLFRNDPYWIMNFQAGYSLAVMADHRAYDSFISELYLDPWRDYSILGAALIGLGMMGDQNATPHLLTFFGNVGPGWMKGMAAQAVAMLKDSRGVPVIGQTLVLERVQPLALVYIEALLNLGDKAAIPYLQKTVDNPSRTQKVRDAAQKAIDQLKKPIKI
jgi:HEAT repeat protein